MARFRILLLVFGVASTFVFSGCSGKSGVSVTLTPSTTPTINQGATQSISATVSNDSTNAGVTWTLSGPGVLSDSSTTAVTYVAPSVLSADTSATVTATAVANTNSTATLTITVDAVFAFISTSLESGTLHVPYSGSISAGGAATPFTWAIISGALPPGLVLSTSSGTSVSISGIPTVEGSFNFTVQVTNSTGTPLSQSFTIVIAPPPALSVATRSLADGTQDEAYSAALQAVNGTPPYSWKMISGNLPAGLSLSTAGLISGTATAAGTSTFTVQVTDSAKSKASASVDLSLTIDPNAVNDSKLIGSYAFLVNGFDPNGRFVEAGRFEADGAGNITNGVIDSNDPANLQLNQSFSGTYLIGLENLGTMTFTGMGRTFALSMTADGNAKIIEFDTTGAQATGVLLKQDASAFSTAQIAGTFAFGLLGADPQGNRFAMAGEFSADGLGGLSAGEFDSDGSAGAAHAVVFSGGYSIPTVAVPSGRGTMTISVPGQGTTNYSFYVVSANELLAIEIDQVVGQSRRLVGGPILKQTQSGTFQASSLGTSVFQTTALETSVASSTPQSQLGLFTATSATNDVSVSADQNSGGTMSSLSSSGTYSVAANGRITLTNSGIAAQDPVLYLVGPSQGFIIGSDPGVIFGFMESQTPPFTAASLSGVYAGGSIVLTAAGAISQVDTATADGVATVSFVTDENGASGLNPDQTSTGTYTLDSAGRGVLTVNGSQADTFYMISPTEFWTLPTSANGTVEMFQQ
ncbi:MAG: putative Ig domain-containing protein [Terriglobales bacterium]